MTRGQAHGLPRAGILLGVLALAFLVAVTGQEVPRPPLPGIETGTHMAAIRCIAVDRAERFLVTGVRDKRTRIWSLGTGDLLRVLRPPIWARETGGKVMPSPSPRTVGPSPRGAGPVMHGKAPTPSISSTARAASSSAALRTCRIPSCASLGPRTGVVSPQA